MTTATMDEYPHDRYYDDTNSESLADWLRRRGAPEDVTMYYLTTEVDHIGRRVPRTTHTASLRGYSIRTN
jgi:hypothetical protein